MKRFLNSVHFAMNGVRFAWQGRNLRVQVVIALVVVVLGMVFKITTTEWLVILLWVALVLSAEVMNSAVEHLVNFVSPEFHPLAGKVKDLAAGAVLVLAVFAAVTGAVIFMPYLAKLF